MTVEMQPSIDLVEAIKQRRAARAFKPDPLADELLQAILELGVRSPSGYNLQPWRFIVVREQQNKEKLKACAFNQRQVGEAPVVLICCSDRRAADLENIEAVIHLAEERGVMTDSYAEYMRSGIPQFFANHPSFGTIEAWTNRHTMLAVAHMMIVAKSYGVDSCPMEGFVTSQVKEAFRIPEEVDVCCLLALGYADEPFKQYGGRFGIEQVCFGESYGESFRLS
ncbi:nitroreductase family protein [Fischerella sp. PCC 9605]|uniref:nitroreductase family protein n=1 Tax=Fischerella sp. PCC 9605 TaxID=1173024 RepID=UPI00047AFA86|nr:nitroreductase family protein [Fischerella sp. PCC 9605]